MEAEEKKKNCRDLLKAVGITAMVAVFVAAVVIGTQQLGL